MSALLGTATGIVTIDVTGAISGLRSLDSAFDKAASGGDPLKTLDASAEHLGDTIQGTATQAASALGKIDGAADQAAAALRQTDGAADQAGAALRTVDASGDAAAAGLKAVDASADQVNQALSTIGTSSGSAANSLNSTGAAAARASQSIVQVDSAADRASRGLNKGSTDAETFGAAVIRLESDITRVGFALTAFGGGVIAALALAAREFIGFEAAMRNVNSIAGLTDKALGQLADQVLELSDRVGQGPTQLAEGLYDIQSSGFEAAEGLEILEKAAIAATAGLTDTGTSARAITAVLNAYGKSAEEAGDTSDLLFSIVDKGVVTFENLANNLGTLLPVAAALKVPFEQVAAAYAQLTLNGISAAQSETALAAAMRSAINPTAELTAAVHEAGFASAEMAIQAVGLSGYLDILMTASGGSSEALSQLLGTAEATTAVLALMNDGGAGLTGMMSEMSAAMSNGAYTQSVFNEQSKSTAFTLRELGVALQGIQVAVGSALGPLIGIGAQGLTAAIHAIGAAFGALPAPVQTAIAGLTGVAGVLAVVGGGALIAAPQILQMTQAFQKLRQESQLLQRALSLVGKASPILLALTGISLAIGAGLALWKKYRNNVDENAEALKRLGEVASRTTDIIAQLNFSGNWKLADLIEADLARIEGIATSFSNNLQTMFNGDLIWAEMLPPEEFPTRLNDILDKDFGPALEQYIVNIQAFGDDTRDILDKMLEGDAQLIIAYQEEIDAAIAGFVQTFVIDDAEMATVRESLNQLFDLFSNPNIDATKLNNVILSYMNELASGQITVQEFDLKLQTLYDSLSAGNDPWGIFIKGAEQAGIVLEDLTSTIDNLKITGMTDAARDIENVEKALAGMNTTWEITSYAIDENTQQMTEFTETAGFTEEQLRHIELVVNNLTNALASGDYNNKGLMAAFHEIMLMKPEDQYQALLDLNKALPRYTIEYSQAVDDQARSLNDLADSASLGNAAIAMLGDTAEQSAGQLEQLQQSATDSIGAFEERATATDAAIQDINDATIEWLGNGENILGFLESYLSNSDAAAASTVRMAQSLVQASSALDSVLGIFREIESLSQRSEQANSIADTLIGPPGELGTLQDLWGRIVEGTSNATLSAEEYNNALTAGVAIQESNARVQDYITSIQAQQLPLLAEQQAAYEEQLRVLEGKSAAEQQHILFLQSAAGQAKIATAYSTAYAASIGELPKEVATELIANSAKADPVFAQTLETLGLIEIGAEGEITINFPDGPTVQETVIELTRSIDALIEALGGVPPLHMDVEGEDAVNAVLERVESADGATATVNFTTGDDGSPLARLLSGQRNVVDVVLEPVDNVDPVLQDKLALEPQILIDLVAQDNARGTLQDYLNWKASGIDIAVRFAQATGQAQQPEKPQNPTSYPNMLDQQNLAAPQAAPIVVPPVDTKQFDASIQALHTAASTMFNTTLPTSISTGMGVASTNVGTGATNWGIAIGIPLQTLLTAVNAVFVTAIPLNVLTGMQLGTANITAEAALWAPIIDAIAPLMGVSGLNAGSVAGYGAANGMANAKPSIEAEAGSWPGIIDGIAGAMGANGYNAGSAAGYGVANGITDATPAAVGAATSLAEQVNAALNAVIQPGSPSKVTTKLGKTVPAGLVVGMESGEDDTYSAAATLGRAAERGLNDYLQHIQTDGDWLNDALTSIPNGTKFRDAMRQVWDNPQQGAALKSYMEGVLGDGDYYNDMLMHLPRDLRDSFAEWGKYIADGLMDASEVATRAVRESQKAFSGTKGKWYDPRADGGRGGGVDVEPGTPGTGGTPPTTPPAPTTPETTIERDLTGIINPLKDAIEALGLGIDISARSFFSEAEWKKREDALGLTKALEISDLFRNRAADQKFANGAFIPGKGSRYTEYYGSPLFPDIANMPDPTKPPVDPTKPGGGVTVEHGQVRPRGELPNRPNYGGNRVQTPTTIIYQSTDARTTVNQALREPELIEALSNGRKGRAAHAVVTSSRERQLTHQTRYQRGMARR
jgi:TP901 family phage tail tape measure protein